MPQDITAQELQIRVQEKIVRDILHIAEDCPIRLTGSSPSVFVYGPEGMQVSVAQTAPKTYVDPATVNGSWDVTVHGSGLTVNGYERPYIYYEYSPVSFAKPQAGWVVNRSEMDSFVAGLAAKMKLNSAEAARLQYEAAHGLKAVKGESVFVGLIDQKELNTKLPLTFSKQPQAVDRIHFYLSAAAAGEHPAAPVVTPVVRAPYMVLELGSYGK